MTNPTTKQKKSKEMITDQEILQKAIEKAVENGLGEDVFTHFDYYKKHYNVNGHNPIVFFIFSHNFAKAFWGEDCYACPTRAHIYHIPNWKYQLTVMVLEENPIKYLEKYL